ncbi:MAG: hypothetical protein JW952_06575 [Candidatus Eisenbacteria bacterium]|nr:hypothetical protein [Candidatus Eisenbacteria bacterium]
MKKLYVLAFLSLLILTFGCGDDDGPSKPKTQPTMQVDTLLTGLEYPTGLWVKDGKVYFTETAGRNTGFGGKIALTVYDVGSGDTTLLADDPVNSDAVVVASDGMIYLTSYLNSIPGDQGKVSAVDPATKTETHVVDIAIAACDMFIEPDDDIYIIGSSDTPGANSIYLLSAGAYTSPSVLHTGLGRTRCISKSGATLYYADIASIWYWSGSKFVNFADKGIISMSFSSKYLFYSDHLGGTVGAIDLSTKADVTLCSGLNYPLSVRWDDADGKLYFVECGSVANQFKDGTLKVVTGIQ